MGEEELNVIPSKARNLLVTLKAYTLIQNDLKLDMLSATP